MKRLASAPTTNTGTTLLDILRRTAREYGHLIVGEESHSKLECGLYKIEYDQYQMNGGIDEVLRYDNCVATASFRNRLSDGKVQLAYWVQTPYQAEQIEFLRRSGTKIGQMLSQNSQWLQGDERKASVLKCVELPDVSDVYPFLTEHIEQRRKTF